MKKYEEPRITICFLSEDNIIITSLTGSVIPDVDEGADSGDMGF